MATKQSIEQPPVPRTNKHGEVQELLTRFARAFTTGDGKRVATMWAVPAVVISADETRLVTSRDEVEAFFGGAQQQYNERGVTDTRPEIQGEDWVGDGLVVVKVRWPHLDAAGREVGAEASDYTLRRDPAGQLQICAVLMRGVEAAPRDGQRSRPEA
jgi:ketosteroid isomerase-like protein